MRAFCLLLLSSLAWADASLDNPPTALSTGRLEGPFPSLKAWCSLTLSRWKRVDLSCEMEEKALVVADRALSEARMVAVSHIAWDLAVRTPRGWYVLPGVGWSGGDRSLAQAESPKLAARRRDGTPVITVTLDQGHWWHNQDLTWSGWTCDRRLIACSLDGSGVPRCTQPIHFAWSEKCAEEADVPTPEPPIHWDWRFEARVLDGEHLQIDRREGRTPRPPPSHHSPVAPRANAEPPAPPTGIRAIAWH